MASSVLGQSQDVHCKREVAFSLTSRGKLRQVLVLSMARLRRVWLWGILRVEAGKVPSWRRRRGMLLLAILVRAIRGLLHLRVWEGKWHPREVVIRHCGRSAARRGRSFARSLGHRVGGRYIVVQGFRSGPQQMRCVRFHYAQWVVGTCCCWLSGAAPAVDHVQNRGPRSSWSRAQRDGRWAAISPALQLAGASRCQGKQGDQQRAARRRACTSLRKPTLYYLRLDLSCTAHCCIIVHSF